MILGIGIDIVEIERIRDSHQKLGNHFIERFLLSSEIEYCLRHSANSRPDFLPIPRFELGLLILQDPFLLFFISKNFFCQPTRAAQKYVQTNKWHQKRGVFISTLLIAQTMKAFSLILSRIILRFKGRTLLRWWTTSRWPEISVL